MLTSRQLPYSCHAGKILIRYFPSCRKRPPPISDHLGLAFWVVAYDCTSILIKSENALLRKCGKEIAQQCLNKIRKNISCSKNGKRATRHSKCSKSCQVRLRFNDPHDIATSAVNPAK